MNHNLRFRVWDKINSCYLESMDDRGMLFNSLEYKEFQPLNMFLGDRYVIEQFTGLKDRNGTEIYVGDILQFKYTTNNGEISENFEVRFLSNIESNCAAISGYYLIRGNGDIDNCWVVSQMNIVGNIHENPELLAECQKT